MRSLNMQKLTDQVKARHPGVVVYGIGDEDHQGSSSGHNEDDTPGSKAEDTDADTVPEHRAIDTMIGPNYSESDAAHDVHMLVTVPANQRRLLYVIYDHTIWSRSYGWVARWYDESDPHTNHWHASGEADDDANTADWVLDEPAAPAEPVKQEQETDTMLITFIYAKAKDGKPLRWGKGVVSGGELYWFENTDQGLANGQAAAAGISAQEVTQAAFDQQRAEFIESPA